ncbi:hypothetical protein [Sphingopyxis fribergensis]
MQENHDGFRNLTNEEIALVSGGIRLDNYTPQGDIWDLGSGDGTPVTNQFWNNVRAAFYIAHNG